MTRIKSIIAWAALCAALCTGMICLGAGCILVPWVLTNGLTQKPIDDGINWEGYQNSNNWWDRPRE